MTESRGTYVAEGAITKGAAPVANVPAPAQGPSTPSAVFVPSQSPTSHTAE